MIAITRAQIKINGKIVPKGTQGVIKAVSNSKQTRAAFPDRKVSDWFYLVEFPECEETILELSQIDILT